MSWLFQLHETQPVAQAIGILALVCVGGMAIGSIKVRGLGLGTAGVLFVGHRHGYFSKPIDHATLAFVKEFGLLLFVFTIGLQLGPGFFAALRRDGLQLNVMAVVVILFGAALAVALGRLLRMDFAGVIGMLSGATTSTPSLAAAQQTMTTLPVSTERLALPALAYAVSYPAAIAGIMGTMVAIKSLFRIDAAKEAEALITLERRRDEQPEAGPHGTADLTVLAGHVSERSIVVTCTNVLGKTIEELALDSRYGVVVSRAMRADHPVNTAGLRLKFGDVLHVIGESEQLERVAQLLGDSIADLNETHFIPLFMGIALGIILGTVQIAVPGMAQPIRLGLAGGPLIVALVLGRVGHIARLVFHMPMNANLAFREFGIALFFAATGLAAGPGFFAAVFSTTGLLWLVAGLCVTVVPLLIAGILARTALHMNFAVLGGLLAGSVTDPPALAFVNNLTHTDAPTLSYVTVYPLATLLRILTTQALALLMVH